MDVPSYVTTNVVVKEQRASDSTDQKHREYLFNVLCLPQIWVLTLPQDKCYDKSENGGKVVEQDEVGACSMSKAFRDQKIQGNEPSTDQPKVDIDWESPLD